MMLLATLAHAWKMDASISTLGVPLAKYKPQLNAPAMIASTTGKKCSVDLKGLFKNILPRSSFFLTMLISAAVRI